MRIWSAIAALVLAASCAPAERPPQAAAAAQGPYVTGIDDPVALGRHLVLMGGCNDCHTAGYPDSGGATPEAEWLKGSPIGHYGPWGTTYASNLRLVAASETEDQWVERMKTVQFRPPMPWYSLHAWSDRDLRVLYRYIGQLGGDPGAATPVGLPPSPTPPAGPYYDYTHGGPPPAAPADAQPKGT